MEHITSRKNKIITHLRALGTDAKYRAEAGEFVCDGVKLLDEALAHGARVTAVLWSGEPLRELSCPQYTAPRELLEYASYLKTTPGPLFSVAMPERERDVPGDRLLILDGVQDPGNVGTVIRSANAFGVDAVLLTGECADPYNPKTARATMGAVFRQRVLQLEREEIAALVRAKGLKLCGAALTDSAEDIRTVNFKECAFVVGSEGRGISPEMLALCDKTVIIPMAAECESLNAAVAASIIAWEMGK